MNGEEPEYLQGRRRMYRVSGIQAIEPFEAGHLVTDADLNEIVDAIKELDLRLKALERK